MSPVESDIKFIPRLGEVLVNEGFSVKYIPKNEKISQLLTEEIEDQIDQSYINHTLSKSPSELQRKYDIKSVRSYIFPQMSYNRENLFHNRLNQYKQERHPFERYKSAFWKALDYLDQLFESGNGGVPIQNQGAEILRRALQKVVDFYDFSSIWVTFSPIPGYTRIRGGEYTNWPGLGEADLAELSESELHRAEEYLSTVRSDQPHIGNTTTSLWDNLQRKSSRVVNEGFDILPLAGQWMKSRAVNTIKRNLLLYMYHSKAQSESLIRDVNYIFYPLQWFRESRVTVRAPAFYDQSWIIEYLSRSLPTNYQLILKPHPNHVTAQTIGDALKISEQAEIIHPSLSAHDVIKHSDAVVTLNNTVGYEAILYGTPVLTLGDAFYGSYKHTLQIEDINNLADKTYQAVNYENIPEENILAFIHDLFEGSSKGEWGDVSRNNVSNIVDSITAEL